MRRMVAVALGMMLAALAAGAGAQGAVETPQLDYWGKLVAANDLDVKGNTPFHMGMTFQLYDLDGKPTETGSFETWWAEPGSQRTVVHLVGLNENGSALDGKNLALQRNSYLVRQLIESAVRPVPLLQNLGGAISTKTVDVGKGKLDCSAPGSGSVELMNIQPTTVCVEPQKTDAILLQGLGGKALLLRLGMGKFHETHVALDVRIAYLGVDAVAGKVTIMQSFDPVNSEVKLPAGSELPSLRMSGGVIAGHRIWFKEPSYPPVAKMQHASGFVLLNAIIGEDGSIERLVPIASTHAMFTDEAMKAVKQWKYSPYLLNGNPTEVDSTITVNFELPRD